MLLWHIYYYVYSIYHTVINLQDKNLNSGEFNLLLGDNYTNFQNHYYSNVQEIEKLELIIAHKDKLLA